MNNASYSGSYPMNDGILRDVVVIGTELTAQPDSNQIQNPEIRVPPETSLQKKDDDPPKCDCHLINNNNYNYYCIGTRNHVFFFTYLFIMSNVQLIGIGHLSNSYS